MKRIWVIFCVVFFFTCGCEKKVEVITIANEETHQIFQYPKTNIKKLDKEIEDFVLEKQGEALLQSLEKEVNVDYTYYEEGSIISIVLFKTKDKKEIKTFNYDKKKNIFYKANELFDIKDNIYFSFDKDNIILYNIEDNEINMTFIPRNDKKMSKIIDMEKKVVALTFDDGPTSYTKKIVDVLKQEDAVATFFVIGNKIELYKDSLSYVLENNNEIGNHTYNHKWLTKLKEEEVLFQINKTNELLKEHLDYETTLFRPSYGSLNQRIKKYIPLDIILWDVDTLDWKYKKRKDIVRRATFHVSDLDIILMHDGYPSLSALPYILLELKKQGFSFVTVSELNEIKKLKN